MVKFLYHSYRSSASIHGFHECMMIHWKHIKTTAPVRGLRHVMPILYHIATRLLQPVNNYDVAIAITVSRVTILWKHINITALNSVPLFCCISHTGFSMQPVKSYDIVSMDATSCRHMGWYSKSILTHQLWIPFHYFVSVLVAIAGYNQLYVSITVCSAIGVRKRVWVFKRTAS